MFNDYKYEARMKRDDSSLVGSSKASMLDLGRADVEITLSEN
jgi:hypothetical protein